MSDIVMSIHPEWAVKIYAGEKKIEWRKTKPKHYDSKMKVYLYETAPVKKVTGYFMVERTGLDKAVNGGTSIHCEKRVFTAQKEFSLISLKQSIDAKGILKGELVHMFKAVWEKATSVVDRNMRAYAVADMLFPVQGNWRDRHG